MKNLLPDTLAARAMILLVLGLAVTHFISTIFYATDRDNALISAGGGHAIQWVATAGALTETLSPEEWPNIVDAAEAGFIYATLTDAPVVPPATASDWREAALQRELDQHVEPDQIGNYRISYAKTDLDTPELAYWRAYLTEVDMSLPAELVLVSLRLSNGSWINTATPIQSPARFFSMQLGFSMAVMLIAVVGFSALIVGRMTDPLKKLSRAAEQLGTDVRAPAIPEVGPVEVRRTARAFNEMQNRIRRFVEDRTQMLAAIAHDLGTPVTRLRLRAEFVEDDELREKMLRDLDDMQHMVASTLSFIREDTTSETQETVELGSLLARVCDDIQDTGSDVTLNELPRWVLLECRPAALRRAIANLVENAVKYGTLARVTLHLEADTIVIRVDDEGPGIPESFQEDAFQPFHRLDASRNLDTGGTGLGLAVARTIARAHGGDIILSNLPQVGLRAELRLPRLIRDEKSAPSPNELKNISESNQHPETISRGEYHKRQVNCT